ncbi:hypothetical protein C8R43DRAFT_1032830 [Mycena crocata]|nr:hypothetical protein C8R43DRAFT_1032830 [Mycena crocata]
MIPQELVDTILYNVKDREFLKQCSLAAQTFRDTSQRILFRSLTLRTAWSYGAFRAQLTDSPYIATYVTRLAVHFPPYPDHAAASAENLQQVLNKLTNVHRLTIEGNSMVWADVALLRLGSTVVGFTQQQSLMEFHVGFLNDIPWSVLALLVSCAPTVSFYCVTVPSTDFIDALPKGPVRREMTQLLLVDSSGVADVLARQEFSLYTAHLLKLGLTPHPSNLSLLSVVGNTLEHVHFERSMDSASIYPFPPLGALGSIEVTIRNDYYLHPQWLASSIASIVVSTPAALQEIGVTYHVVPGTTLAAPYFEPYIVATLGRLLADCSRAPCFRWRLHLEGEDDGEQQALLLADFTDFLRAGFHTLHEKGKLIVERYWESGEWALH